LITFHHPDVAHSLGEFINNPLFYIPGEYPPFTEDPPQTFAEKAITPVSWTVDNEKPETRPNNNI
jgi:hypothetical protein